MWHNFDGKPYDTAGLAAHIAALDFSNWRPRFVTLHNTSEPTIEQWLSWSPAKRQQYIINVQHYYEHDKGWHAGPHFFVPPERATVAFGFSNPVAIGVHCSCFNAVSIGIEMVGEFNVERFDDGPGEMVRDNAVYLMALLHNKLGISPDTLRFHIECKADDHDCPGRNVNKADMIARVKAKMAELTSKDSAASLSNSNSNAGPGSGTVTDGPGASMSTSPASSRRVVFSAHGKMSTFGGPKDFGMTRTEGLALYNSEGDFEKNGIADYLLSPAQAGAPGLGRRLNPDKLYIACRWPYAEYDFLRGAKIWVKSEKIGFSVAARAVDWGPNINTGRVADLSPALANALGLDTNDTVTVTVYEDGQ